MTKRLLQKAGWIPAMALAAFAQAGLAGELEVRVSGFPSDDGQARFVLMAGEAGYRGSIAPTRIGTAVIKEGRAIWRAADLPPGAYAVIAHHDVDANGALNRPAFNLPTEPYGYSNGGWTSFGLPSWEEVSFAAPDEGAVIQSITLRKNLFALIGEGLLLGLAPLLGVLALLRLLRRLGPGRPSKTSRTHS